MSNEISYDELSKAYEENLFKAISLVTARLNYALKEIEKLKTKEADGQ